MSYDIKEKGDFQYIEEGTGETLLLLHGLFGALSNFADLIHYFSPNYRVVIPLLPIYELPLLDVNVPALSRFVKNFVNMQGYHNMHVLGNSLGGHVAIMYTLECGDKVQSLTLTGSSGLFENSLGGSFPKRGTYEYIKERTEYTFYDPKMATTELVDEVFEIVNNKSKALRVISMARSAMRNNMSDELHHIKCPTLLIWGKNDRITPEEVGYEFKRLIPQAELHFLDNCGHAPMMEKPAEFNMILGAFLQKVKVPAA